MDPNEALQTIRDLVDNFNQRATYENMDQLVENVEALDKWLSQGGFFPDAWDHPEN